MLEYDTPLPDEIAHSPQNEIIRCGEAGVDCLILLVGLSGFSPLDHYRLGQCIAKIVGQVYRLAYVAREFLPFVYTGNC